MSPKSSPPIQLTDGVARERERHAFTGVPPSSWYSLQAAGLAPKPVRLGPNSVGWLRRELSRFVEQRAAARDAGDPWQSLGDAAAKVVAKVVKKTQK